MPGKLSQAAAGGPITPQLAQAAAQSGAPPVGAEAGAGAPPPTPAPGMQQGGPMPAPQPAAPSPGVGAPPPAADPRAEQGARGGMGPPVIGDQPASADEQQEYERAITALARVLYANDKTANAIVDQVDPNDKVGSTAKVSILLMRELDRKINMADVVIAPITEEVVTRIAELAEARHSVEFNPAEVEQALGAAWEGVAALFGSDGGQEGSQSFQQFASSFDAGTLEQVKQQYEAALNG